MKDWTEWAEAGHAATEFSTLMEAALPPTSDSSEALDFASIVLPYQDMLKVELPPRRYHLPWLSERANVMVFGRRGVGKTFFQLGLAAALTNGMDFLCWPVTEPVGVLYIDGEMPLEELRTRTTQLLLKPPAAPLEFLTSEWAYHKLSRDLVLTDEAMRDAVTRLLDARPEIRVLILDNISCLFAGLDEDKKRDWEPIAAWLIRLRHRGMTTILAHHEGKSGAQRGTSGREDALDTVLRLRQPANYDAREGCHFDLSFTKTRSVKGDAVSPLDVKLADIGGQLQWQFAALDKSKEEEARDLLAEGNISNRELAEALGVDRSYAWKLKKKIEQGAKGRAA